ncbi:MAG TPA: agmatine deiminase family protein [Terriglobia bacterium]|nr:agmatine deiminase family protein [Terriglobia bacterium]
MMKPASTIKADSLARDTAASLGFRLPAEWEPHDATWIGWPHNRSDWPGKFAPIPWVYAEIVRHLVPGERVRVLATPAVEARARRVLSNAGVDPARVEFYNWPTNRGWTRDYGPFFLRRPLPRTLHPPERRPLDGDTVQQDVERLTGSGLAMAHFRFNAWAKYPDWHKDAAIPDRVAAALGLRVFQPTAQGREVILEGGSIDVNGYGTLITTEECLLDETTQARNPGSSREELERVFADYLGVRNVLWLGRGIAGDDTHGHVDDLCRFVGPRTVVLCREDDPHDANYRPLEENRDRLEGMRLEDGSKVEVVSLPMPSPVHYKGQRLPASYANFYIGNAAVLVPTFNDPRDRVALGTLAELIRDRPAVGIHAVDLVWGLGTLHCLTLQQPAVDR